MGKDYTLADVDRRLDKLLQQDYISDHNGELVSEFIAYLKADRDVSNNRIFKYVYTFDTLFEKFINFDLDTGKKQDYRLAVAQIRSSEYSEWTSRDMILIMRRFLNTYFEDEVDRPDHVKRILSAKFMKTGSNIKSNCRPETTVSSCLMRETRWKNRLEQNYST